jgi:hypothetical protein
LSSPLVDEFGSKGVVGAIVGGEEEPPPLTIRKSIRLPKEKKKKD